MIDGTDLHNAARDGKTELLRKLVINIPVNSKDVEGKTPLVLAVESGRLDTVIELETLRADCTISDSRGMLPIHYAAKLGYHSILDRLATYDTCNKKDKEGNTPLHYAVRNGHVLCISVLIKNKAKIDLENNNNNTPLDEAETRTSDVKDALDNANYY